MSAVPEVETFSQWVVQGKLAELGIEMKVSHTIEEIGCNKVVCNGLRLFFEYNYNRLSFLF
ncbi:hypothetical protein [Ruminiclostridium papyrosolvens]|uniref:hypothetical protein n=1 Tax=Ruminiclostridium papyrosolvens TaxID=29362 RepID=UPI000404333E|nr:hypothetical protein [Ruminiclostridium papyrosolvens]